MLPKFFQATLKLSTDRDGFQEGSTGNTRELLLLRGFGLYGICSVTVMKEEREEIC